MAELDAAMGGNGMMVEGGEIRGGIERGRSHWGCKKSELNKQMIPFILRNVCILS